MLHFVVTVERKGGEREEEADLQYPSEDDKIIRKRLKKQRVLASPHLHVPSVEFGQDTNENQRTTARGGRTDIFGNRNLESSR